MAKMNQSGMANYPFSARRGFTLVELIVTIGILLLVVGMAFPFILTYRGKSQVDRAQEVTEATLERAAEDAKTGGFPFPDALKQSGLTTLATAQSGQGTKILLRQRRRTKKGEDAHVVSQKQLSTSDSMRIGFSGLGVLDLASDTDTLGMFVEFAETDGTTITPLATVPVDVNGEFLLESSASKATVWYSYGDYRRELYVGIQGTVSPDRR